MITFSRQNGVAVLQCINEDEDALEKIKDAMDVLDISPARAEDIMDEIRYEVVDGNYDAMSQDEFMNTVLARMESGDRFVGQTHYTHISTSTGTSSHFSWSSSSSSSASSSSSSTSQSSTSQSSSSIIYGPLQFSSPASSGARWGKSVLMNVWRQASLLTAIDNFNANIGVNQWKDT